jgi:outer membrane protein OmpA-like peptidoglycan-associated protein
VELTSLAVGLEGDLESTTAALRATEHQLQETEAELQRTQSELTGLRQNAARQISRSRAATAGIAKQRDALAKQLSEGLGQLADASRTEGGYNVSLSGGAFPSGKSALTTDAKYVLAKLSGTLLVFPDMKLSIEGHTDSTGSDEVNLKLSEKRAESVKTFLNEMGVAENRITATGHGSKNPIAPNDTSEGRSKNRRVEIIMTEPR